MNVDTGQFEVIITEQVAALAAKVESIERREEAHNALAAMRATTAAGNPLSQNQLAERFSLTRAQATKVRQSVLADRTATTPASKPPARVHTPAQLASGPGSPPRLRLGLTS